MKSVKQSEISTYQWNTFENLNIADIKSVIREHSKTSHKLYKTEKVASNSSCIVTQEKVKNIETKNM